VPATQVGKRMKDISHDLPSVVRKHIETHNAPDPEGFIATFAPDGLVNDNRREFLGHTAVKAWADKELFGDKVKLAVHQAFDNHGDVILRGVVTGDFDKTNLPDPLILTYYFSLGDGAISQLIIILNTSVA
jgi:hypothetical protein